MNAGIPSMREPASRENDFSFCRIVRKSSLFPAHPTYWQKRVTPKMQRIPPDVDFEYSRSTAKSES